MSESPRKIVIVGAGASARLLTKQLKAGKESLHITIIQPNKFASMPYYQTMVLTKQVTFTNNSTFSEIPGADETVYGVAVSASDGFVSVQPLEKDMAIQKVPFDILVAATGISVPSIVETPGQSKEDRQKEIDEISNALLSGNHVVIAGGGSTGVELAADVLEGLPENERAGKVTLVSSADKIWSDQTSYYGDRAEEVLKGMGCEIIFNDRVTSHNETTISKNPQEQITLELKSGKTLKCHAYVPAFSRGANTSWLKDLQQGKVLDDRGKVDVDEYLMSTAYDKLYAVGAVNNRKEPSLFINVDAQTQTVAKNILKPKSAKQAPGTEHAMYGKIGKTFATWHPENLPMPGPCATLCCNWCGFPCNFLCPCFCLGVICGPCDPMVCGYCCGKPEGKGLSNTLDGSRKMNMMAKNANYLTKEEMERS